MKAQHQVILSIGSNQGNRLEVIKNCIALLHQEIGTVIQVSRVYETAAWGFDSDAFYNCALVLHSHLSAEEVLLKALAIEQKLGRIRKNESGYQSRIIDIDMIAFDEAIIETQTLTVPHPLMQDRKFVLLPFQDLKINWMHPILNKSISELVKNCSDTGDCIAVADLENPLEPFSFKKGSYIAFEGNIGAGKTSLATKIAEDFNTKILFERFAENSFLAKFYKDQERYAFPLELSFLVDRYQQLSATLAKIKDLQNDILVADYHVFKSLIFAKVTLEEEEYQLYKNLFEIIYKEIPKPDLYVFLLQSPEQLLKNIQKRGRDYEQEISVDYLEKINKAYLSYLDSQTNLNVLIVDVTNRDFVNNQSDYLFILDEIQKRINY